MSRVVILFGPPGSGKGTQANLLEKKKGFFHFDTGAYIEQLLHDPGTLQTKTIRRERKIFDTGKLNTPTWILGILKKRTAILKKVGSSIVFSGSPRTLYEASGLLPFLLEKFGIKNIFVFHLNIKQETTIFRNTNRRICSLCGQPMLYSKTLLRECPFCGAALRTRVLDTKEVISVRLKEYAERTEPILAEIKKYTLPLYTIDAEPMPEIVFRNIVKQLT